MLQHLVMRLCGGIGKKAYISANIRGAQQAYLTLQVRLRLFCLLRHAKKKDCLP